MYLARVISTFVKFAATTAAISTTTTTTIANNLSSHAQHLHPLQHYSSPHPGFLPNPTSPSATPGKIGHVQYAAQHITVPLASDEHWHSVQRCKSTQQYCHSMQQRNSAQHLCLARPFGSQQISLNQHVTTCTSLPTRVQIHTCTCLRTTHTHRCMPPTNPATPPVQAHCSCQPRHTHAHALPSAPLRAAHQEALRPGATAA